MLCDKCATSIWFKLNSNIDIIHLLYDYFERNNVIT